VIWERETSPPLKPVLPPYSLAAKLYFYDQEMPDPKKYEETVQELKRWIEGQH